MRRLVLLLAAGLLLAACGPLPSPAPASTAPPMALTDDRPLTSVTPGAILAATAAQVCTSGWAGTRRRSLTVVQRRRVLAAYGLRPDQPVAEWDHLVALELAGDNGTANIWPELDRQDAARKDRLEGRLHHQVCAGRLDLDVAQARVRQFWRYW